MLNPFFLMDINETSWRSLSGVRANKSILQIVPNVEVKISFSSCSPMHLGVFGTLNIFLTSNLAKRGWRCHLIVSLVEYNNETLKCSSIDSDTL